MLEDNNTFMIEQDLEGWVINKCDGWRDHYEANYSEKFEEYYRLWRGQWSAEDIAFHPLCQLLGIRQSFIVIGIIE